MNDIIDNEDYQPVKDYMVIKTIALFTGLKLVLDLINHYFIIPLLPNQFFESDDFQDQSLGFSVIIIMLIICIFFVRKIDPWRPYTDEKIIALWTGLAIFIGEILFWIITIHVIDQSVALSIGWILAMIKDSLIMGIQASFMAYVVIHKVRRNSIFFPLIIYFAVVWLFDYLYTANIIQ